VDLETWQSITDGQTGAKNNNEIADCGASTLSTSEMFTVYVRAKYVLLQSTKMSHEWSPTS